MSFEVWQHVLGLNFWAPLAIKLFIAVIVGGKQVKCNIIQNQHVKFSFQYSSISWCNFQLWILVVEVVNITIDISKNQMTLRFFILDCLIQHQKLLQSKETGSYFEIVGFLTNWSYFKRSDGKRTPIWCCMKETLLKNIT